MPCSHPLIPQLDLQPWKEPDSGEKDPPTPPLGRCLQLHLSLRPLAFRSQMWSYTWNPVWPLAAVRLGGSVSVPAGLQAVGIVIGQLRPSQSAVELQTSDLQRYGHQKQQQSPNLKYPPHSRSALADINECEEQTLACPENFECVNLPGSFACSGLFRSFEPIFGEIVLYLFLPCSFPAGSRTLAAGDRLRGRRSDGAVWWSGHTPAAGLLLPQVRPSATTRSIFQ